jgi:hypothetical protein
MEHEDLIDREQHSEAVLRFFNQILAALGSGGVPAVGGSHGADTRALAAQALQHPGVSIPSDAALQCAISAALTRQVDALEGALALSAPPGGGTIPPSDLALRGLDAIRERKLSFGASLLLDKRQRVLRAAIAGGSIQCVQVALPPPPCASEALAIDWRLCDLSALPHPVVRTAIAEGRVVKRSLSDYMERDTFEEEADEAPPEERQEWLPLQDYPWAVHEAVVHGNSHLLLDLVRMGARVDAPASPGDAVRWKVPPGCSPLAVACIHGMSECVERLLGAGAAASDNVPVVGGDAPRSCVAVLAAKLLDDMRLPREGSEEHSRVRSPSVSSEEEEDAGAPSSSAAAAVGRDESLAETLRLTEVAAAENVVTLMLQYRCLEELEVDIELARWNWLHCGGALGDVVFLSTCQRRPRLVLEAQSTQRDADGYSPLMLVASRTGTSQGALAIEAVSTQRALVGGGGGAESPSLAHKALRQKLGEARGGRVTLVPALRELLAVAELVGLTELVVNAPHPRLGTSPIALAARNGDGEAVMALWHLSSVAKEFGGGSQAPGTIPESLSLLVAAAGGPREHTVFPMLGNLLKSLLDFASKTAGLGADGSGSPEQIEQFRAQVLTTVNRRSMGTLAMEVVCSRGFSKCVTLLRQLGAAWPETFQSWAKLGGGAFPPLRAMDTNPAAQLFARCLSIRGTSRDSTLASMFNSSVVQANPYITPTPEFPLFQAHFNPGWATPPEGATAWHPTLCVPAWESGWLSSCAVSGDVDVAQRVFGMFEEQAKTCPSATWESIAALRESAVPLSAYQAGWCTSAIIQNSDALVRCAAHGQPEFARLLLRAGAHPDGRRGGGEPLRTAAKKASASPQCELVGEVLIEAGASVFPSESSMYDSPIICAVQGGSSKLVKRMIERGAFATSAQEDGRTALFLALCQGNKDMVDALLSAPDGHSPEVIAFHWLDTGENLVHAAVKGGNVECLAAVLALGAEPDHRDNGGVTPLFKAAEASSSECMIMLLRAGADAASVVETAMGARGFSLDTDGEAVQLLVERAMRMLEQEATAKRQKGPTESASASSASAASEPSPSSKLARAYSDESSGAMDLSDLAAALSTVVQTATGVRPPVGFRARPGVSFESRSPLGGAWDDDD